jgi:hypothetical protein
MVIRDSIETIVNIVLALGFIILVIGIGLWVFNLSQRFCLQKEAMLVIFGCLLLIFGALAAKLFAKVGS